MTAHDSLGNRLELSRDTAIQTVVIKALVMRLVRFQPDGARRLRGAQGGIATTTVPAAICHVLIQRHIVPAIGKQIPITYCLRIVGLQQFTYLLAGGKAKTGTLYLSLKLF